MSKPESLFFFCCTFRKNLLSFWCDKEAFKGALQREKVHTDAARLTCGRGLEEEVRDHAKVKGLLAHGGEGHGTSEPRDRETNCRGARKEEGEKWKEKNKISFSKERREGGRACKTAPHDCSAHVLFFAGRKQRRRAQ